MSRGLFISFEGSEGCGKSTQITLLAERLQAKGLEVELTREPGGTPLGETIRHLLKFAPEGQGMCAEAELLLFVASRAQLVRERILPALARGAVVISDRFFDSTTVYQGVARRLAAEDVRAINSFAVEKCLPDVTFLLDLDAAAAQRRLAQRASERPDRMEAEPLAFYEAVRQGYLELAAKEPKRIRALDASGERETIAARIWEVVNGLL